MIDTIKKNYVDGTFVGYIITYQNSDRITSVPLATDNSDYQAIQEWIADGGTVIDNPPE